MNEIQEQWEFRLYVAGYGNRSAQALINLKNYCSQYLDSNYTIEVIDLRIKPELAEQDQIIVLPTVVRISPHPIYRVTGDLSDRDKVLARLGIFQAIN